jgi:hypothetical protein
MDLDEIRKTIVIAMFSDSDEAQNLAGRADLRTARRYDV